ncbi:hypothetical protein [Amaricoccus macauensis]|uniref:hypothetical protein n=1 Tax=Amaricoccus macauensis TaxID=57001 RepID=UPI003C7B0275
MMRGHDIGGLTLPLAMRWLGRVLCSGYLAFATQTLADPPPVVFEATESALALCDVRGEEGQIREGYETTVDLNGDALPDYILDFGKIECGGAGGPGCGSFGCEISVWLSRPNGEYQQIPLGRGMSYDLLRPAVALPSVQVIKGGQACAGAGLSSSVCTQTWHFAGETPEAGPVVMPAPRRPEKRPPPEALPRLPAEPGWTLRQSADGRPVALGIASGNLQSLGAFCLQDMPFLVLRFAERPAQDELWVGFGFSSGVVEAQAHFEETAGDAFVIDLSGSSLAARLAGADQSVDVAYGGSVVETISLAGSSRSLRAALGPCLDL